MVANLQDRHMYGTEARVQCRANKMNNKEFDSEAAGDYAVQVLLVGKFISLSKQTHTQSNKTQTATHRVMLYTQDI